MLMNRSRARRRNLLLAALPPNDFSLLAPHLRDAPLEQGAVLQEQGERIDQVYFPHEGIVSLLAVMQQGDAIETATIGYEGAVGTLCPDRDQAGDHAGCWGNAEPAKSQWSAPRQRDHLYRRAFQRRASV